MIAYFHKARGKGNFELTICAQPCNGAEPQGQQGQARYKRFRGPLIREHGACIGKPHTVKKSCATQKQGTNTMQNPGFYVYQGSSGDWYIDCLTSARDRIGYDLIRKTEGVWSTKQAAWDALDLALGVITLGEWAYHEDLRRRPYYDGGTPRRSWAQLDDHAKASWERDPTPREWKQAAPCA